MGASTNAVDVLREAFAIYARHISVVLGLSFGIQALWVVGLFVAFQNGGLASGMLTFVFLALFTTLLQAATMTRFALAVRQGHDPQIGEIVMGALPKLLPLFGLLVVMFLPIGIGLLFFIVPGLILLLRWAWRPRSTWPAIPRSVTR